MEMYHTPDNYSCNVPRLKMPSGANNAGHKSIFDKVHSIFEGLGYKPEASGAKVTSPLW